MSLSYTHGREFLRQTWPYLEQQDTEGLAKHLSQYWPNEMLKALLSCEHEDAVKATLVCLSLAGTMSENASIAHCLNDDDPNTSALAEHALWSIWFRAGDESGNADIVQAVQLISENKLDQAIACLDRILLRLPNFAEAYNQRAIVYYLKEDYERSCSDCEATLRLNPHHFGAMAGLGHCCASLGDLDRALEAYCNCRGLHPRLEGIRQSIQQIRQNLSKKQALSDPPPLHPAHAVLPNPGGMRPKQ